MSNMLRRVRRNEDKKEIMIFRKTYNKKPKIKCPKCKKKTAFYTNTQKEVYCLRCNEKVK